MGLAKQSSSGAGVVGGGLGGWRGGGVYMGEETMSAEEENKTSLAVTTANSGASLCKQLFIG